MRFHRAFLCCATVLLWATTACNDGVAPSGGGDALPPRVVITPRQVRLVAVGDTTRLRAALYDGDGNPIAGRGVTWLSADPGVFTIDASGLVTGRQAQSVGRAIASAAGTADTAYVVVANPDASPCLGYAAPVALAVGQAIGVSMSDGACITSAGGGDEYVVMPWFGTSDGSRTIPLEVTGSGLSAPGPNPFLAPLASRSLGRGTDSRARASASLQRDFAFERRIREMGRHEVMPLASRARAELARRALSPTLSSGPAYLSVGDLVQLNSDPTGCSVVTVRTGRVIATSARAIVVADTNNPTGGFADSDYARIAAGFDTLVAPVEDAAFGTPTDIDANGKVILFFTRAVNELTAAGATFVTGYFNPRDLLPEYYQGQPLCPASNERELFYLPVPDPGGTVNGNTYTTGFIDTLTIATLAHENQHLVNFGRRLYVNDAVADEEPWLNEGLSDIAQELVFYRATGLAPRQNIGSEHFGTQPFDGLFTMYMAPNFARFATFLQQPQKYSPYSSNDQLGTYGAIWSFLRYAADHSGSSDANVWLNLTNSQVAGFDNLFNVFGGNLGPMLNAWSLSLYTDDATPGVDSTYSQPSWNFRSAFPSLPLSPQPYPLLGAVGVLPDGVSQTASLRGGGSAYFRFAITTGTDAVIALTSNGLMPPATVQATIVRTK
ncbi:MAG TPA: hypothetical protein VJN70_06885 [Gemmatimonadaceae bacterium]|nr:hypothetical protein [Gemmatimonadaceae bacterium]